MNKQKIIDFFIQEKSRERYKIGDVLDINTKKIEFTTTNNRVEIVGGLTAGDFVIVPMKNINEREIYFILGRIIDKSDIPLEQERSLVLYENAKRNKLDDLDIKTKLELDRIAYSAEIIGEYYSNSEDEEISFASRIGSVLSAIKYEVFVPDNILLDVVLNSILKNQGQSIGVFQTKESKFRLINNKDEFKTQVKIIVEDFLAKRTALFGKTRSGKSNTGKIIAQIILDECKKQMGVGQLIFDINGEFANDNVQDKISFATYNKEFCEVYSYKDSGNSVKPMSFNMYEYYVLGKENLNRLIELENSSQYIKTFININLMDIEELRELNKKDKGAFIRAYRKIIIFWCILYKAGYEVKMEELKKFAKKNGFSINPNFSEATRKIVYKDNDIPKNLNNLEDVIRELEAFYNHNKYSSQKLKSSNNNNLFDDDDDRLLDFLFVQKGRAGVNILTNHKRLHRYVKVDFLEEIKRDLKKGKVVIIDLTATTEKVKRYFSEIVCKEIFKMQEMAFITDEPNYIQIYFEEAHNLFPENSNELNNIYSRIAKEGAKNRIGMIYATQSPSSINKDLLGQTENFFIGYLSSEAEANIISKNQARYKGLEKLIITNDIVGHSWILTQSNRFVVPCKIDDYNKKIRNKLKIIKEGEESGL